MPPGAGAAGGSARAVVRSRAAPVRSRMPPAAVAAGGSAVCRRAEFGAAV